MKKSSSGPVSCSGGSLAVVTAKLAAEFKVPIARAETNKYLLVPCYRRRPVFSPQFLHDSSGSVLCTSLRLLSSSLARLRSQQRRRSAAFLLLGLSMASARAPSNPCQGQALEICTLYASKRGGPTDFAKDGDLGCISAEDGIAAFQFHLSGWLSIWAPVLSG